MPRDIKILINKKKNRLSEQHKLRGPRVLVLMASTNLGGPGRGLLQLLESMPAGEAEFYVSDFSYKGHIGGEYYESIYATGWPVVIIPQSFSFDPRMIFRVKDIVRELNIDIIQSHGYKEAVLAFFARIWLKKKWIAFFHGFTSENLKIRFYQTLYSFLLRFADVVAFVSPSQRQLIENLGVKPDKLHFIPNAIEPIKSPESGTSSLFVREKDELYVCVVGRLSPEKGQKDFIFAFREVVSLFPSAKAWFLGDGPQRDELEKLVRELQLQHNIHFVGYVPEARCYLHFFDILVLPSLSEGMPNVLLEAMSSGVPTIATRVGAVPWLLRHKKNGWIIDPGSPSQLAESICNLLANSNLRKDIALEGKKTAKEYTIAKRLKLIKEIYSNPDKLEIFKGPG